MPRESLLQHPGKRRALARIWLYRMLFWGGILLVIMGAAFFVYAVAGPAGLPLKPVLHWSPRPIGWPVGFTHLRAIVPGVVAVAAGALALTAAGRLLR
jgi:hypothetical protein